jgi:hypothetical protein
VSVWEGVKVRINALHSLEMSTSLKDFEKKIFRF